MSRLVLVSWGEAELENLLKQGMKAASAGLAAFHIMV